LESRVTTGEFITVPLAPKMGNRLSTVN